MLGLQIWCAIFHFLVVKIFLTRIALQPGFTFEESETSYVSVSAFFMLSARVPWPHPFAPCASVRVV